MDERMKPYAGFLENLCKDVAELQPAKIAVVGLLPGGEVYVTVCGDVSPCDMGTMAFRLQIEAVMDVIKANAKEIIEAAQENDEDEQFF